MENQLDKLDNELTERRKFTHEERMQVFKKTDGRCGHCGKKMIHWETTVDHIIPLNKGGLNDEFNLIGLCLKCNEEKSNFLYDAMEYYPYILNEYVCFYNDYQTFASYDIRKTSLLSYDTKKYIIYPDKQKDIILSMMKRRTKKKKIENVLSKIGIPLFLTKAYSGDAVEIMRLVKHCEENKNTLINETYYTNEYVLLNDIKYGEVYVLRKGQGIKDNDKICGAFMFKRIKNSDVPFVQIETIIENTNLNAKYMMTGAFIDKFAHDAFNDIMDDFLKAMLQINAIPMYFDILNKTFVDKNKCILMPWTMDGYKGVLEFMTLEYLRKSVRNEIEDFTYHCQEELTPMELDLAADMLINYKEHAQLVKADKEFHIILEEHPYLKAMFKPEKCPLYKVGFIHEMSEEIQDYMKIYAQMC